MAFGRRGRIGAVTAPTSPRRRAYVLGCLTAIAALSLVDRVAVGIVQEPLRHEFGLTDFQLGLLGGPAFAILYSALGIPLARVAERRSRVSLVSVALLLWSIATGLCGLATSYAALVLGRLGVSVGEAGCTPASQSIIVDYYPPERRGTALAVYALATPIGSIGAGLGGGFLAQEFGWRATFLALGAIGVAMAGVLALSVREPPRVAASGGPEGFRDALKVLRRKTTFWNIAAGASLASFVGYGVNQYFVSFAMRSHGLNLFEASQLNALAFGVFGAGGTFIGGVIADRTARRRPTAVLWGPAIGLVAAAPLYMAGYLSGALSTTGSLICAAAFLNYIYVGAQYYVVHGITPSRMRNTAVAVLVLLVNVLGFGLGPPVVGLLSDMLSQAELARQVAPRILCDGARASVQGACAAAKEAGLRHAIVIVLGGYGWAGLHFWLASRTMVRDWEEARP